MTTQELIARIDQEIDIRKSEKRKLLDVRYILTGKHLSGTYPRDAHWAITRPDPRRRSQ